MPSTPVFKEKWKEELEHWFNSIEPKIEKDENDDEIYHVDPVILVEWNEAGLTQRGIIKANVIAVITGTNPAIRQYIDPDFVAPGNPGNQQGPVVSDSIFCIDAGNRSHQIYLHVIRRLQAAYLQNSAPGAPSLGRVFWVTSPRANTLQIDETYNVRIKCYIQALLLELENDSESKKDGRQLRLIMLSSDEWDLLHDLIVVLASFEQATRHLSGKKYVTYSIIPLKEIKRQLLLPSPFTSSTTLSSNLQIKNFGSFCYSRRNRELEIKMLTKKIIIIK
ncbi:hypothetical protein RhiirA4_549241 [Rhizophagus irregularis]|uniref:Uncharacterized protein n=1 Tax=Rhizophagus irregularis TaxID=588596 RepID=A0A2I1HC38_9GLOM|nr:hypothetical protein RhiirA4_549241 [Rhizophagus irregularis]